MIRHGVATCYKATQHTTQNLLFEIRGLKNQKNICINKLNMQIHWKNLHQQNTRNIPMNA